MYKEFYSCIKRREAIAIGLAIASLSTLSTTTLAAGGFQLPELNPVPACSTESTDSLEVDADVVAKKGGNVDVTRIRVNGVSSFVNLFDPNTETQGFAWPTRDEVTNTSALDFSYVTPTSDPNVVILFQGAGEIPNSAYTTTSTTTHLVVTTPFPVIRCEVIVSTGFFECAEGAPISFDLFWNQNGFSEIEEHIQRRETIGPLTIRFKGKFFRRSATVTGFWNGSTAVELTGDLFDTQNTTIIREIEMAR